jgi:hypothetical protein
MTEPAAGMLAVTMQPPDGMEEEFHAWYDTEHVPEREAVPGFVSAARFVCAEGWPLYIACYDLTALSVLKDEAYQRIGGKNLSVWSKRMLSHVVGYERLELTLAGGASASVAPQNGRVLIRLATADAERVAAAADSLAEQAPQAELRAFENALPEGQSTIMLDAPALALIPRWSHAELAAALGELAPTLRGVWRYHRYRRSS